LFVFSKIFSGNLKKDPAEAFQENLHQFYAGN
jgi:hypothetical protein